MKEFCKKLSCCFCRKRNADTENPLLKETRENNKDEEKEIIHYKDVTYEEEVVFEHKFIREDERGIISFSKKDIKAVIDQEFASNEGYDQIYNKENMVILYKASGSIFTDKFPIVRMSYTISRNEFPNEFTIDQLAFYMSNPDKRMLWDKGYKNYQFLEGNMGLGLLYIFMKKPIVLMSDRDSIEKVIWFKDDSSLYSFSSSVNETYIPLVENVTRITDYFSCYVLTSDDNSFYINSLSQMDLKMNISNFLLKITLPLKLKEWFKELRAFINQENDLRKKYTVLHSNTNSETSSEENIV